MQNLINDCLVAAAACKLDKLSLQRSVSAVTDQAAARQKWLLLLTRPELCESLSCLSEGHLEGEAVSPSDASRLRRTGKSRPGKLTRTCCNLARSATTAADQRPIRLQVRATRNTLLQTTFAFPAQAVTRTGETCGRGRRIKRSQNKRRRLHCRQLPGSGSQEAAFPPVNGRKGL